MLWDTMPQKAQRKQHCLQQIFLDHPAFFFHLTLPFLQLIEFMWFFSNFCWQIKDLFWIQICCSRSCNFVSCFSCEVLMKCLQLRTKINISAMESFDFARGSRNLRWKTSVVLKLKVADKYVNTLSPYTKCSVSDA